MKIADVNVGQELWTKVSGDKVRVKVVRIEKRQPFGRSSRSVRRVVVRRVDNGKLLPKARSASALQPTRSNRTVMVPPPSSSIVHLMDRWATSGVAWQVMAMWYAGSSVELPEVLAAMDAYEERRIDAEKGRYGWGPKEEKELNRILNAMDAATKEASS